MPLDIKYIQGKILTIEVLLLAKENKPHKKILNSYLEYFLELSYRLQISKTILCKKEMMKIIEIEKNIDELKKRILRIKKDDNDAQVEIEGIEL